MNYAVDSKDMKKIDDYTVEVIKLPALVLMERAALKITEVMKKLILKSDRILAVCGPGNNGGDGIAAGRILFSQGYQVAILFLGDEAKATNQTKAQLEIAKNLGIPLENNNKLHEYNIIIDAIFGVGLSRPVTGEYEVIINAINKLDLSNSIVRNESNRLVFSVDIPSGISADNGKIMNTAVRANHTITFGLQKLGLLMYPGAEYAGEITVADIGFSDIAIKQANLNTFYYSSEDLNRLPAREKYSHKGTYGKVLVIAGSKGMSGAAYLSAKAAYRTGAGIVKVLTSRDNREILQTSLPESLFAAYDQEGRNSEEINKELLATINWASVIVIGPGLGQSEMAEKLLNIVIKEAKVPVIIDADGLNVLANILDCRYQDAYSRWNHLSEILKENMILTPHLKELSRLLGIPVTEIMNNMIDTVGQYSYNNKLVVAIKDARSVVINQHNKYINVSGNNGMATGGSGDVLTGIIAALIAQGMTSYDATCLAVYVHGLSGDIAASEKGSYSMMAGDIIDSIEKVIKRSNQKGQSI